MNKSSKRRITPAYIFFYILFSKDTWRIALGIVFSIFLTPRLLPQELSSIGQGMLYVMMASIGWVISAKPSEWITTILKKGILGNSRHS